MKKVLAIAVVSIFPVLAFAQDLQGLLGITKNIINMLVPILIGLAVVYFLWQVIQYTVSGDEDKKKEAKMGMLWGIIGIFVMVSVWGLVSVVSNTTGIGQGGATNVPNLPQ
jgi:hypothetical protein